MVPVHNLGYSDNYVIIQNIIYNNKHHYTPTVQLLLLVGHDIEHTVLLLDYIGKRR